LFKHSPKVSAAVGLMFLAAACGPPQDAAAPARPPLAEKWLTRAKESYRAGDMADATDASDSALKVSPRDPEVRMVKARVSLSRLDFTEAAKLSQGIATTEAHQLRARALWYGGDLESAAEEIDAILADPNTKDVWASDVGKLARTGQGRHPFAIEGGLVGAVEMPRAGASLVVPCELDGERILAVVDTAVPEFVIDSTTRREPAWVNLRFDHLEVKDVPAVTRDLTPISRQFGATIKALIGVNALRHMHVTFDRHGDQFVVRKDDPPAPPDASRVPLFYARGGLMMLRAGVNKDEGGQTPFFLNTSAPYYVALEDATWKRAGVDLSVLRGDPSLPDNVKSGVLPLFRVFGFDLPDVPGYENVPLAELKSAIDIDLGGVVGSAVLSLFRVTFGDDGRFIWVEPDPTLAEAPSGGRRGGRGAPPGPPPASDITPPTGTMSPGTLTPGMGKPPAGNTPPAPPASAAPTSKVPAAPKAPAAKPATSAAPAPAKKP
jgi:hypothetical protein